MKTTTATFIETDKDTIVLHDKKLYDIGGRVYSLAELQQHAINSSLYTQLIAEIKGGK